MKMSSPVPLVCAFSFAVILGFVSGFQVLGLSRDYDNYLYFFEEVQWLSNPLDSDYRFEPGFTVFGFLLTKLGFDGPVVYSIIAGFGVFLKYWALGESRKYCVAVLVFTFFYCTRYFFLFEMTVLRASCAFSLAFFVFYLRRDGVYKVGDFALLGLAFLMHYSAAIFVFVYLFKELTRKKVLFVAGVFYVFVYFVKGVLLSLLSGVVMVFSTYEALGSATFIPIPFALDLLLLFCMLCFWNKNDFAMKVCVLGVALSAAVHFALVDYSLFASRFRELLSVFVLIYIVKASFSRDRVLRWGGISFGFVSGLLYLYANFYHDPLLA